MKRIQTIPDVAMIFALFGIKLMRWAIWDSAKWSNLLPKSWDIYLKNKIIKCILVFYFYVFQIINMFIFADFFKVIAFSPVLADHENSRGKNMQYINVFTVLQSPGSSYCIKKIFKTTYAMVIHASRTIWDLKSLIHNTKQGSIPLNNW